MIQNLKRNITKLQLDNYWDYSHAQQVDVAAYRMVSHYSIGFLPFYLVYRHEPLMLDEIPFTAYLSDEDYEVVLSFHIQDIMELNQSALQNNQLVNQKLRSSWIESLYISKLLTSK